MELRMEDMKLEIEAVDLGDLDMLEEDIVPCTGCGCSNCACRDRQNQQPRFPVSLPERR
jgi:hypothetical protein